MDTGFQRDNRPFLTEQIITYLGNKRALLREINEAVLEVRAELGGRELASADMFSGSGIAARLLKQHSRLLIANDLEEYSRIANECHLSNKSDFDREGFAAALVLLEESLAEKKRPGIITHNYAPEDESDIKRGERVFYTRENALIIDTYRWGIDNLVPGHLKTYFLARLITEASIHTNTSGVFKGFYKDKRTGIGKYGGTGENALSRIRGRIELTPPVLSDFECERHVSREDANALARSLESLDLAYIDPPYDQHPFGSNYFMLNVIAENGLRGELSPVSGIPAGWNRSRYNKKRLALETLEELARELPARYLLISYNNEGFIPYDDMLAMLSRLGSVAARHIKYNAFRGSRNLRGRELYTREYLFLIKKS